jgi:DNA-3-methyladenine glycosylase I
MQPIEHDDGKARCRWCSAAPEFLPYHDHEWGFPVADDIRLFEKICLESFQSGLSWRTILAKREHFRRAFHGFDFNKIATYTARDVNRLLADESIVRHRGKIEAAINNAKRAQEAVAQDGSLASFLWKYEPHGTEVATPQTASTSPASVRLSKELKKRGWTFVGPTTVYAFMQAMGMVNDHADACFVRTSVDLARRQFVRP